MKKYSLLGSNSPMLRDALWYDIIVNTTRDNIDKSFDKSKGLYKRIAMVTHDGTKMQIDILQGV